MTFGMFSMPSHPPERDSREGCEPIGTEIAARLTHLIGD